MAKKKKSNKKVTMAMKTMKHMMSPKGMKKHMM